MSKILQIAIAKLKPYNRKWWCARLSYAEIVALNDDGWEEADYNNCNAEYVKAEMSRGKNGQTWTYWKKMGKTKKICRNAHGLPLFGRPKNKS